MSVQFRFSEPDYDILLNPTENESYVIGNSRGDFFAWCDFNGFGNLDDVKSFMEIHPQLVIMDDSDNIFSFDKFASRVRCKEHIYALPLDDQIESALLRAENEVTAPFKKSLDFGR